MASKLEQDKLLIGSLDASEKRGLGGHINDQLKIFDFLELPPELRNCICHLAAISHLRDYGTTKRPGLLCVNKQVRREFMSTFYSSDVMTAKVIIPTPLNQPYEFVTLNDSATLRKIFHQKAGIKFDVVKGFELDGTLAESLLKCSVIVDGESTGSAIRWGLKGMIELETGGKSHAETFDIPQSAWKELRIDWEPPEA